MWLTTVDQRSRTDYFWMVTSPQDPQDRSTSAVTRTFKNFTEMWRCQECKKEYVVPSLARDCEAEHEALRGPHG